MPKKIKKKINIKKKKGKPTPVNFQDTILNLQKFWGNYGCGKDMASRCLKK